MTRSWMWLATAGCAPVLTGSDQVADINVDWVASADAALENGKIEAADDIVEQLLVDADGAGCALGLVLDGEVLHLEGYGLANVAAELGDATLHELLTHTAGGHTARDRPPDAPAWCLGIGARHVRLAP